MGKNTSGGGPALPPVPCSFPPANVQPAGQLTQEARSQLPSLFLKGWPPVPSTEQEAISPTWTHKTRCSRRQRLEDGNRVSRRLPPRHEWTSPKWGMGRPGRRERCGSGLSRRPVLSCLLPRRLEENHSTRQDRHYQQSRIPGPTSRTTLARSGCPIHPSLQIHRW
jgi:hypothetical protein